MKTYYIKYIPYLCGEEKGIDVLANNKYEAYDKAIYELLPQKEGCHPYSAWVSSVTYSNGNYHRFNTHSGKSF